MKNFNFEDAFNFFDEDFFNVNDGINNKQDPFGLGATKERHGIHLMYLRKQNEGKKQNHKLSEEPEIDHENIKYKDNLPYDMYGPGNGLESTHPLQFWLDKKQDLEGDDWEEEVESDNTGNIKNEKKNLFNHSEDDDSDDDDMEEDYFADFFEENTKELKSGKFS